MLLKVLLPPVRKQVELQRLGRLGLVGVRHALLPALTQAPTPALARRASPGRLGEADHRLELELVHHLRLDVRYQGCLVARQPKHIPALGAHLDLPHLDFGQ
eukprot:scaffold73122_cov61-Phaeocystis_antarctica.AAC.3